MPSQNSCSELEPESEKGPPCNAQFACSNMGRHEPQPPHSHPQVLAPVIEGH